MAVFNPQFESPDPSYLKLSKPITQPLSDTSTGIALATAGNALDAGVTLADTTIKGVIKKQLDDTVNAQKDDFINQLYAAEGQTPPTAAPKNPMDANASMDVAPPTDILPPALSNSLARVRSLGNAFAQAGKSRTTNLDADLVNTLKDARTRFPGYRDYVDQVGKSTIGYDPANKLINDKLAEINEQKTNQARQQEFWERRIVDSGYDKWDSVLKTFQQDHDITKVERWYGSNVKAHADVDNQMKTFQLEAGALANKQMKARMALSSAADEAATGFWRNKNTVDETDLSSEDIQKKLQNYADHPELRDDVAIGNLAAQFESKHQRDVFQINQKMKSLVNKDGESIYSLLGPEEYNKIIEDRVGLPYRTMQKLVESKDFGLLGSTQRALGWTKSAAAMRVVSDGGDVGQVARTAAALNDIGPNLFSPELMEKIYGRYPHLSDDLLKVNSQQLKQGASQIGGTNGGPYTHKQAQNEIQQAAPIAGSSPSSVAQAYKNLIDFHKALLEKNPTLVDNAITFFYHPDNKGTLSKFMDDYYDAAKGSWSSGRTSAFSTLTGEDVTKSIRRRYEEGNTPAWDNYKRWGTEEAAAHLTTIAANWSENTAANEHNVQDSRWWSPADIMFKKLGMPAPPKVGYHYYYDNEAHHLGLLDNKGEVIPESNMLFLQSPFRNVNKLFDGLTNIAHAEGSNPDAIIFEALRRAWPQDTEGKKIFRAVANSYGVPQKEDNK